MSRSRVDLPEPFTPISPVLPGPKVALSPDSTTRPFGKEKDRSLSTTDIWKLQMRSRNEVDLRASRHPPSAGETFAANDTGSLGGTHDQDDEAERRWHGQGHFFAADQSASGRGFRGRRLQ